MSSAHHAKDPLEPMKSATGCLLGLTLAAVLLALLERHQQLWASGPVCTSVASGGAPVHSDLTMDGLAHGVQATAGMVTLCASNPSPALRLFGLMAIWPTAILWLIFVLRLRGLFRTASKPGGLYAPATAGRLRSLGWITTAGAIAAALLESAAKSLIYTNLVHYPGIGVLSLNYITFPFSFFFLGLALLTVAQVMRVGATMREELDGTI